MGGPVILCVHTTNTNSWNTLVRDVTLIDETIVIIKNKTRDNTSDINGGRVTLPSSTNVTNGTRITIIAGSGLTDIKTTTGNIIYGGGGTTASNFFNETITIGSNPSGGNIYWGTIKLVYHTNDWYLIEGTNYL